MDSALLPNLHAVNHDITDEDGIASSRLHGESPAVSIKTAPGTAPTRDKGLAALDDDVVVFFHWLVFMERPSCSWTAIYVFKQVLCDWLACISDARRLSFVLFHGIFAAVYAGSLLPFWQPGLVLCSD